MGVFQNRFKLIANPEKLIRVYWGGEKDELEGIDDKVKALASKEAADIKRFVVVFSPTPSPYYMSSMHKFVVKLH